MLQIIGSWYKRYFTDPQAVQLGVLLLVVVVVFFTIGKLLAPLLAAIIIAYLLEGGVRRLQRTGLSRNGCVYLVFGFFIIFMTVSLLGVLPIISQQLSQFIKELPNMINNGQQQLLLLPEKYPEFISRDFIYEMFSSIRAALSTLGHNVLSISAASIPAIITTLIYLILVPTMIFFFLKDKHSILNWVNRFVPYEPGFLRDVWCEMDTQIGNYVRGKLNELVIIGIANYIFFVYMGLNYSPLLSILVGCSVLIPYLGVTVITIPVTLVAYFQWGLTPEFGWFMLGYLIIQFVDGNILVPVLFSDAVNLHPIAIIMSIIVFGGLWGFWGVFFAIPLAALVKALINIWPVSQAT